MSARPGISQKAPEAGVCKSISLYEVRLEVGCLCSGENAVGVREVEMEGERNCVVSADRTRKISNE